MRKNSISELEAISNLKKVYIRSEEIIIEGMKSTETTIEELAEEMGITPEKFVQYFQPENSNFGFYSEAITTLEKNKIKSK